MNSHCIYLYYSLCWDLDTYLQILGALQKWLLYRQDDKMDENTFNVFLTPLVSQLSPLPTLDIRGMETGEFEDSQHMDDFGGRVVKTIDGRVVKTIVQMAVSSGSDAMWKPLHHQASVSAISFLIPWLRFHCLYLNQNLDTIE